MTQITGASSKAERPVFRYDLQTTAIEEGGNRYVDVRAPDGGESFRFYEVEYAVACGMDGERDVPGIVRWAMLELDLQTTPAEVSAIVSKLTELNYIEGVDAAPASVDLAASAQASVSAAQTVDPPTPVPAAAETDSGFELGNSGKASVASARPARPSDAADLELGTAGRSTEREVAAAPDDTIDSEFELGVAGNEGVAPVDEVATELAAPAEEVEVEQKAAPEEIATKVITPAELPADVVAAMTEAEESTPELVAQSSDISDSIAQEAAAEVASGKEAIALQDSAENQAKRAAAAAAEKEREKERAEKRAARRPTVRRSASLVLWLILLGSVAGAAYYYFFYTPYVLEHPAEQPLGLNKTPRRNAPVAPEVPADLAAPSTMTVTEIPSAEALAARAGVVEWVSDPGSEVTAGDIILKIRGSERLQAAVDKETTALETYQLRLETAEAREDEDEANLAAIQADIDRKQADLDAATAKLAPFVVSAPIDGVVEVLVKARDKVKASQPIGKVTGMSKTIAVFTLSDGNFAAEGEEYVVEAIDDGELKTTCVATEVVDLQVTLECPSDSGIAAGAAVRLVAPVDSE